MFRKGRKGLTAAVLAALLAVPLGAAEAAGGSAGYEPKDVWSRVAEWLWAKAEGVTALWTASDEGSSIDPDGAHSDAGSDIDPWGRSTSSTQSDLGSSIDPNG